MQGITCSTSLPLFCGLRLTELECKEERVKTCLQMDGVLIWYGLSRKADLEGMDFIEAYKLNEAYNQWF